MKIQGVVKYPENIKTPAVGKLLGTSEGEAVITMQHPNATRSYQVSKSSLPVFQLQTEPIRTRYPLYQIPL